MMSASAMAKDWSMYVTDPAVTSSPLSSVTAPPVARDTFIPDLTALFVTVTLKYVMLLKFGAAVVLAVALVCAEALV